MKTFTNYRWAATTLLLLLGSLWSHAQMGTNQAVKELAKIKTTVPDHFIGMTVMTTSPLEQTNVPASAGYKEINYLQLWENHVLLHVKMAYSQKLNYGTCLQMDYCKNVPISLWINALRLLQHKTHAGITRPQDLFNRKKKWETDYKWWTPKETLCKSVDRVEDLPLSFVMYEQSLRNELDLVGKPAAASFPSIDFIGFRWMPGSESIPANDRFQPDSEFAQWLRDKITSTPPNLFQIVRKANIQAELLDEQNRWIHQPIQIGTNKVVLVELFYLPHNDE